MAMEGLQVDSGPSHNVRGPEFTLGCGRATSGLRSFSQRQVLSHLVNVGGPLHKNCNAKCT